MKGQIDLPSATVTEDEHLALSASVLILSLLLTAAHGLGTVPSRPSSALSVPQEELHIGRNHGQVKFVRYDAALSLAQEAKDTADSEAALWSHCCSRTDSSPNSLIVDVRWIDAKYPIMTAIQGGTTS